MKYDIEYNPFGKDFGTLMKCRFICDRSVIYTLFPLVTLSDIFSIKEQPLMLKIGVPV